MDVGCQVAQLRPRTTCPATRLFALVTATRSDATAVRSAVAATAAVINARPLPGTTAYICRHKALHVAQFKLHSRTSRGHTMAGRVNNGAGPRGGGHSERD